MKRDHPFWTFSLDRYRRDGVPSLCLRLQDEAGADVNIVLFCLWLASKGYEVDGAAFATTVMAPVNAWHDNVVRPLREVRRYMKGGGPIGARAELETVRQRIKAIEIETESVEQSMLYAIFFAQRGNARGPFRKAGIGARAVGEHNIRTYLEAMDASGPLGDVISTLAIRCL